MTPLGGRHPKLEGLYTKKDADEMPEDGGRHPKLEGLYTH